LVNPVTVAVVTVPATVTVALPGDEATLYEVIAPPPVAAGAVQVTVTCPLPAVAVTPVGAPGGADGVTAVDAADAGPVPVELAAVTVNVYEVPLASPVTVAEVAVAAALTAAPLDAVTVYPVIADPPSHCGAVQDTVACAFLAAAVTPVGAPSGAT
jgi:hypothetical protein